MDEKLFQLVSEWTLKAEHDLGTAETLIKHSPDYTDVICFHCQQAVEKFIKAYLCSKGISFQKSHDLNYLWELLEDEKMKDEDTYSAIDSLNAFSVASRYPGFGDNPTFEEACAAYGSALKIRNMIIQNKKG